MIKNIQLFLLLLFLSACSSKADSSLNDREAFNSGWLFMLQAQTDTTHLALMGLDDSLWRKLDLPHDWAIEGDFCKDNPSGTGGGALPGGIGWYRKHFSTPSTFKKEIKSLLILTGYI